MTLDQAIESTRLKVDAADTVIEGATIFINSVPAMIQAAKDEAAAAGAATPAQMTAITNLGDKLTAAIEPMKTALLNVPTGAAG